MSILFSIPDELCLEILSEWVNAVGLCAIDSAVCCRRYRQYYLTILTKVKNFDYGYCYSIKACEWVYLRSIPVHSLTLVDVLFDPNHKLVVPISFEHIQKMIIFKEVEYDQTIATDIINKCIKLNDIWCSNHKYLVDIDAGILMQLNALTIVDDLLDNQLHALARIKKYCRSLTSIECKSSLTHFYVDIVSQNSLLKSITISADDSILEVIGAHCRLIEHVRLYLGKFDSARVGQFIGTCCKTLQSIRVQSSQEDIYFSNIKSFVSVLWYQSIRRASDVINLFSHIKTLHHCELRHCHYAGEVVPLIAESYRDSLISVKFHSCIGLTSHSIHKLLVDCSGLERLSLASCGLSSEQYIEAFDDDRGFNLSNLTILDAVLNLTTIVGILQSCRVYECSFEVVTDNSSQQPALINVLKATIHQSVDSRCSIRFTRGSRVDFNSGVFSNRSMPHFM